MKLFIGSLPYSTNDQALKDLFAQAGTVVSATVIMDKFSGRSKGFGFIEMSSDDEAKKAIEMFNGKDFEGRALIVNEARPMVPREQRPGGGFGGGRPGGFGGGRSGGFGGGHGRGGDRGGHDDRGGRDW